MTPTTRAEPPPGIAVVDKPAGWTSHQVVGRARRLLGTRKVGHAGTLDPMATGVLVLGVGRATRLLGQLTLTDKSYDATIRIGQATVTDDAEGEVTQALGAGHLTDADIESAMAALRGPIQQVPSSVSAIKVNGVRSYARVRSGDQVTLPARSVTVTRFDVLGRRDVSVGALPVVDLDVTVDCSSGTYVRALARDLGTALDTGGHLTALRRTRVGPFTIAEAQPLDREGSPVAELAVTELAVTELAVIGLADVARRCFPTLTLTLEQARDVGFGRNLADVDLPDGLTALLAPSGAFLALYRPEGAVAVAEAVFVG
jgi:tRNA pseudouridine55 synthase